MPTKYSVALLAFVSASIASPRAARGGESTADETLRKVLRVYQTRSHQMDSIHVQYRLTRVETSEWVLELEKRKKDKKSAPAERTERIEGEYARKGEKILSRSRRLTTSGWNSEKFWLYNGELSVRKSNRENEYLVTKSSTPRWMIELPTSVTHEQQLLKTLEDWAEGRAKLSVSVKELTQDGHPVLQIDLQFPETKWRNTIKLLPDRDFIISRFEVTNARGQPVSTVDVTEIKDANGIAYPLRAVKKHFMSENRLGYALDLEVLSVETEAKRVSDELFKFEFPPGSLVFDEDNKTMIRQTELTESHLSEAVRRLAPSSPFWKRWWVYVAACIGIPIAYGLGRYAVRRMRTRPSMPADRAGGNANAAQT